MFCEFGSRALSPLLNGTLHHRYIISALKIIIYNNIICFCLQRSECNTKRNLILYKKSKNCFRRWFFTYVL